MPIRIEITGENADHAWAELKGLAAPAFAQTRDTRHFELVGDPLTPFDDPAHGRTPNAETVKALEASRAGEVIRAESVDEVLADTATTEPAKRGRRKKEAEPSAAQPVDLKALEAQKAAEPSPLISTQPEDRQDPADPVVADEPEAVAEPDPEEPATLETMRGALMDYQAVFGVPAVQEDGPKLMGVTKSSQVPADQYGAVRARIREAIRSNPYGRTPVKAAT